MYKISIIEGQPIIREGLCALLKREFGYTVISSHNDSNELLRNATFLEPDIVILDINVKDTDGTDAIEKIKARWVNVKILIFSVPKNEECIKCAFRAGANCFLHKEITPTQLKDAIDCIAKGQFHVSSEILAILIDSYAHEENNHFNGFNDSNLTARERELLRLISAGYSNKEIANKLCLSIKTIEAHRSNLMKKLNVHNVAQLTSKASRLRVDN
jgi:DNA-binding NarL/FixJ family response regulator